MWYEDKRAIDYDKPIFAETSEGLIYLLMPCIDRNGIIIGYNWFDFKKGFYNSTTFFDTVEKSIEVYKEFGYKVYNGTLSSIRD